MTTDLQTRLETLYGQERRRNKLGLEGTRALLGALGDPHRRFRSVHVAGTNGKGTTCALIERVLRESGYRTGLFTSPHLVDFRERIRVSGQWVDAAWLDEKLTLIESLPEGRDRTFFEVTTALAFLYFAEREVEIAVVEVGLGGRLDTTNVITPEVSVITTIGLDHTEILGETVEEIAREKAGIIKPGVPVVLPNQKGKALDVMQAIALERGAPIANPWSRPPLQETLFPADQDPANVLPRPPRVPEFEARRPFPTAESWNMASVSLAVRVLQERGFRIPTEAYEQGVAVVRWPGRYERCPTQPRLWWDAAHNAHGFRLLIETWKMTHVKGQPLEWWLGTKSIVTEPHVAPGAVVLALSRDKDVAAILTELRWGLEPLRLIATRSRSGRAMDPADIVREAESQRIEARVVPDVVTAVRESLDSTGDDDILLCGSIFAIGEAMETFGGAPGEWL